MPGKPHRLHHDTRGQACAWKAWAGYNSLSVQELNLHPQPLIGSPPLAGGLLL